MQVKSEVRKIRLSFKYEIRRTNDKNIAVIKDLIWHVTKVSNILLYDIKNGNELIDIKSNLNVLSSKIYSKYRENNWHSKFLHSHMLQEAIISVISSYKSYYKLNDMYNKNKLSLKGKPNFPSFKKENSTEIVFTKYAIRYEKNILKLSISKGIQEKYKLKSLNFLISKKLRKLIAFSSIKMIKIRLINNKIELNIIYEKECRTLNQDYQNVMAIDLGLNNIVACTNKDNSNTLLVSGKVLKCKNKYINEKISKLQRINMIALKNSKKHKNTKRIKSLYIKRNNYMNTYMHKVSKMVIDYAKENKVKVVVIGDIKDIKQNMDYNKNFVQVPLHKLVQKIEYKAELEGVKIEFVKETYTSGVSALDSEEIIKENYNKKRRITRGIFITNNNIKINADINGSLNILRKYIKNSSPNQEIVMDNGREQRPLKKNVA